MEKKCHALGVMPSGTGKYHSMRARKIQILRRSHLCFSVKFIRNNKKYCHKNTKTQNTTKNY